MKLECEFVCIDGNVAKKNVVGFCRYHNGYLTYAQTKVHRCKEKNCKKFEKLGCFLQDKCYEAELGVYIKKITE